MSWLESAMLQIERVKTLPDNWDGYGTPSPDKRLIEKMVRLVNGLDSLTLPQALPCPDINATSDYTLQIEWNKAGAGLEVILGSSDIDVCVYEIGGRYTEIDISSNDRGRLVELLYLIFQ